MTKRHIIVLIILIMIIVGLWNLNYYRKANQLTFTIIDQQATERQILEQRNDRITTWVYQHSERISRETAKRIVDGTSPYKNRILMLAIFEVESNFIPSAISNKGARGLGQIHWPSHYGVLIKTETCKEARDLYDIEINIRATNLILTDMLQRSGGDIVKALRLYLGGQDGAYTMRILNNFVQLSLVAEAHGE